MKVSLDTYRREPFSEHFMLWDALRIVVNKKAVQSVLEDDDIATIVLLLKESGKDKS